MVPEFGRRMAGHRQEIRALIGQRVLAGFTGLKCANMLVIYAARARVAPAFDVGG